MVPVAAAIALFAATPDRCDALAGHTLEGAGGFLAFATNGQVVWYPDAGVLLPGLWRCDESGSVRLRLLDAPPELDEDVLSLAGGVLTWNEIAFTFADDPPSRVAIAEAPYDPAQDRCENLVGAIYEIRSLEGLPGSVEPGSPRRPYLQLAAGHGKWVGARGETQTITWHCDEKALRVAFGGKPVTFERDERGFRFGRAPVRRFSPRAPAALDCGALKGRAFEIGERPMRSEPFESADPEPRPPSLVFDAIETRVTWVDADRTTRTLEYTCGEDGVRVEVAGSTSRMTFDGASLRWMAQPVRPFLR